MSTLLPLRPGQSVPDYWESSAFRARAVLNAGEHDADRTRWLLKYEEAAATLSALFDEASGDVA